MNSTILDANQLPKMLTAARSGETVEILDDGWTYRLVAVLPCPRPTPTGVPQAGRWKGKFVVPVDFKEPPEQMREYME